MGYDISFKVKVEGVDAYVRVGNCKANITWNARKIIELSTGLPWENEANNGLCLDVMPKIQHGLTELETNREKYLRYEAKNRWGTVSGTIKFFKEILAGWADLVQQYEELVPVVTFWVE